MGKFIFLLLFLPLSCKQQERKKIVINNRLISFQSKIIYNADSLYLDTSFYQTMSSKSFSIKTDTIKYLNHRIYVSYLTVLAGCAQYYGDLVFVEDTIKLRLINKGDIVCTEQEGWRVRFIIENKKNTKYKIIKF